MDDQSHQTFGKQSATNNYKPKLVDVWFLIRFSFGWK